ncbi:MAG: B12-binding domain-containing radical SAM protein, partial [Candidatus Nanoarchaeia archaeon]
MKRNKKIKVVLISNTYSPSPILLVIHEMIKESGHESKYIHIPSYKHNMPSEYFDNIDDKIRPIYEDADLIAFTCMTHTFLAAAKIIGRIRKYTEAPIAMGGIHSTAKPAECLELAEYACIGEGEMAFMELINRLSEGEDTLNVPGFYVKKDGEIIKNPQGKLVEDLDSLPIPDFGLTDQYFLFNGKLVHMKDHLKNQEMLRQYFTRYYFMVTSRG